MALDLLALALLVFFAWRGARRGALATGLALFALIVGNVAAYWVATRYGNAAAEAWGMPMLLAAPIAGTLAFFAVAGAIGAFSWIARRGAPPPGAASRIGGALFGMLRGSVVVLLVGLLAVWVDAAQRSLPGADPHPPASDSPLRAATEAAVETGVAAALGDAPGAALTAHALARPGEALEQFRSIAAKPAITALADDQELWAYVEAGSYDAALAQPSFQRLQWDGDLRHELAAAGVVDEAAAGDPALFALEARAALAQVGPRLRALREDPDFARLANDPSVAAMVERRDVVGLLAHPGLQRILANVLAAPAGPG